MEDANAWNIHMQTGGGNVDNIAPTSKARLVRLNLTFDDGYCSGKNIRMLGSDARIEFFNSAGNTYANVSGGAGIRLQKPRCW